MDSGSDRRRAERTEVEVSVSLERVDELDLPAPASRRRAPGEVVPRPRGDRPIIRNVSPEGAFVATEHAPPLNARVRLLIEQATPPLAVTGLVVWRRTELGAGGVNRRPGRLEPGFGIRFDGPESSVAQFVARCMPSGSGATVKR